MWVQLLVAQSLEVAGSIKHLRPGDWVDVGKQTAMRWIAQRMAHIPNYALYDFVAEGSGVLAIGPKAVSAVAALNTGSIKIGSSTAIEELFKDRVAPTLPYNHTLLWHTELALRYELLPVGFGLLDIWEAACPLWDYDVLAAHIGTEEERNRTIEITQDLRVPLFDYRLLFLRAGDSGSQLLNAWLGQHQPGDDYRLSFLRAYYLIKPFMLALPVTWANAKAGPMD